MAWSDAAREAARLARQRKQLRMKDLRKGVRFAERNLFRARVNLENFSNPEWQSKFLARAEEGPEFARRQIRDSKSVINSTRRLRAELETRVKLRTPAQKDAAYARKQRKAGKSSIFGGMVVRKRLKGFEY